MHKNSLVSAAISALLLVGCAGSARVSGSASISTPALVYVSPGVQVVENYREPIFYSDSYYWRYSGNVWYRSSIHTSGWVRYQAPSAVLRIERPSAYVYYRGSARASHRAPQSTPASRQDHKDMKEAQKEERKEQQQERKEERREQQEERKEQQEERKEQKNDAKKNRK